MRGQDAQVVITRYRAYRPRNPRTGEYGGARTSAHLYSMLGRIQRIENRSSVYQRSLSTKYERRQRREKYA